MPLFHYTAQTDVGGLEEGDKEAADKYTLASTLKADGLTVIAVNEVQKGGGSMKSFEEKFSRVSLQEKILFTHNLSAMIEAGLPLSRALGVLGRQSKNPKFKKIMRDITENVTSGKSLSESLALFPEVFSSLVISMVKVGEESGHLAESLQVIGDQLEKSYTLRKKIKGAMMYPSIVILAMVIIGIIMLMYVVPTLTSTFRDAGIELPATTKFIILVSDLLAAHAVLVLLGMVVMTVLLVMFGKTKAGMRVMDFIALHFPMVSNIVKEYNTAQTTRTLSSLLSSGVGVVESLNITHDVVQNSYYREVLRSSVDDVQKGVPFSKSFGDNEHLYPPLASEMVEVGEETGKLSDMLNRVANFYEAEVDTKTKDLTTIVEPILMIVIGTAVGFFALAMITPMYELTTAF